MLQALLKIVIIILVVLGISSLIPAKFKEQAASRTKATLSAIIPKSVKEKAKDAATPPMERRAKLLNQLEKNISGIKEELSKKKTTGNVDSEQPVVSEVKPQEDGTKAEEPLDNEKLVKKLEETVELIKKIEKANNDGGVMNNIKTTIYEKVTGSSASCSPEKKSE